MKKLFVLFNFLFLFTSLGLFSQTKISSSLQTTYGNHKHTNRDNLLFTLKDNENNIYLIGTTENDFTFNDIKIIKLNKSLEVLWEKELSFKNGISYDSVADVFIDSENNLILVCKAAYTSFDQTIVLVKYSKNGIKLWDYPFSDFNDPINYDFSLYFSFLDANDNLHITYRPLDQNYLKYHFLTFSSSGEKIEDFTKDDIFRDINHLYVYHNKLTYIDDFYYMIYKIELDKSPFQKFKLLKFNKDTNDLIDIEMNEETTNFINTPFSETYTTIKTDNKGNLAFVIPNYVREKDYMVICFNPDGTKKYTINPDPNNDKFIIEYTFDSENNLIIISNNRISNSNDNLQLTVQKYNDKGELIYQNNDPNVIGKIPFFQDEHILVYTEDEKIIKYDYDLNPLNPIQIEPIIAYNFTLNAITSIGENSFLTGTTHNVNYTGSDFLSEMDFIVRKTDKEKEIASYIFSGLGTSRALILKSLQVINENYVVALTEELGPNGYYPGASNPPINRFILTYDKDFNLMNEEIVDNNDIVVELDPLEKMDYKYTTNEGDIFMYKIENDYKRISFYENEVYKWTRNLTLSDAYEQSLGYAIDQYGNFLVSSFHSSFFYKIHKITPNNIYEYTNLDFPAAHIVPLTNDWIFTLDFDGIIRVLSADFSLINIGPDSFDPIDSHLIEKNNKIIYWVQGEKYIWLLNQFGEIEEHFVMDIVFRTDMYAYDGNSLLYLKSIGSSIYTYPEYSWTRASIEKFNLDLSYLIDDIIPNDADNDGVDDSIDQCRNTKEGIIVNQYGCPSNSLSIDDIELINSKILLYPNPANGWINLKIQNELIVKTIKITDVMGRVISYIDNFENLVETKINLSSRAKGFYFISITFENGTSSFKKFILE